MLALQKRNQELAKPTQEFKGVPLLVKISPDVSAAELEQIAIVARKTSIAGIIATNTTIRREGLQSSVADIEACGEGGLSGLPLRVRSNRMIASFYKLTAGKIPLIGVGGIFTAQDAWEKICAGASLVQLYTGFIYQGPGIVAEINKGLLEIIDREGIRSLDEAVGCRASEFARGS